MADIPKTIANLTVEQRDLLFRRLRAGLPAHTGIPRRKVKDGPVPLSFAQQRLWFVDQLQPGSAAYNIPIAVEITGPLDVALLQATMDALVLRHETLRTTFQIVDSEPVQVIAPHQVIPLRTIDLRALPPQEVVRKADQISNDEVRGPFDLGRGPLLRTTLVHLAPERAILLLVFHHIISDLWSLRVFVKELAETYNMFRKGRRAALPELPIQYADFAVWQREQFQGERLDKEVEHWKRELEGASINLELPGDNPRPPVMGFRGARLDWSLSPAAADALKALGQREESTLFMTLIAAYSVLLARYASQEDLIVGAPVANRSQIELEGLIGFFINMLVLRVELTERPSFRELLTRVKERCVRALQHQDLPFEQLVDYLVQERDLSRQPLVQAALALQNVASSTLEIADLRFTAVQTQVGVAKFDLSFELSEEGSSIKGSLEYNSELFERTTAQRIGNQFAVLLEGIGRFPERLIWELPLLTDAEREQLSWESRPSPQSAEGGVMELVAAMAARQPAARAAAWQGGELSYGELVERSSRVAAGLRAAGVGPEVVVAIVLERSPDLLVGMLGVLAAGGACLPLEPSRDRSWLELTLERSGVSVLLTAKPLLNILPEHGATEVLIERLESGGEGAEPAGPRTLPESLAFVVQTSGSRRAPRQVGLEHRSVTAWVRHWEERLSQDELAGVGSVGALETVDGVFDLIVPLCLGGWVALEEQVGGALWSATPSELAARLYEGSLQVIPRAIRSFGEPLGATLAQSLLQGGVERLHDSYSSAVGGVWEWRDRRRGMLPDGAGGEVTPYVLGPVGEPAPIGVPGELWLSGEGLARDYFARADRTAESFIPDRFSGRAGSRLVKTGDLARWRGDGALELLGGLERRVEVNGQRLDLDATEKLLSEHPRVLRAVAGLQSENGVERLVAYALGADRIGLTGEELRSSLEARLPRPKVPWMIVVISELPRTPERRVDWHALPQVEEKEAEYIAPRTETEEILAEIWRELLNVERVGIDENFFRLGGNSLLATQVVARLNKSFQLNLGVDVVFRHPTLAGMALQIEENLLQQIGEEDLAALLSASELSGDR